MSKDKNKIDVGTRFDRWTVLAKDLNKSQYWVCECDCGNTKSVFSGNLKSKKSRSCGCLSVELTKEREKTHGKSDTREWKAWRSMKNRAHEYTSSNSHYYEERGIGVCDRWVNSFEAFYDDMGVCPEGMTLERIDNKLGYSKDNCKWDSKSRQASNRRKFSSNSSGRTGVSWRKDQNKWRVCIKVDGQVHNVGQYEDYDEACAACTEAEMKYLGYSREDS